MGNIRGILALRLVSSRDAVECAVKLDGIQQQPGATQGVQCGGGMLCVQHIATPSLAVQSAQDTYQPPE